MRVHLVLPTKRVVLSSGHDLITDLCSAINRHMTGSKARFEMDREAILAFDIAISRVNGYGVRMNLDGEPNRMFRGLEVRLVDFEPMAHAMSDYSDLVEAAIREHEAAA